jgi:hypothetical protein
VYLAVHDSARYCQVFCRASPASTFNSRSHLPSSYRTLCPPILHYIDASSSQSKAVSDAALNEYSWKTGKDIGSDTLAAKLKSCGSSSEVHEVLPEQAQLFDELRNGGQKVMRKLKPTVDVLPTLSNGGVLGNGIGLVASGNHQENYIGFWSL